MSICSIACSNVTPGRAIDRRDAVLLECRPVAGMTAPRQQAAVHLGVQRLHPPVHHLGEPGDLFDGGHRYPSLAQRVRRAAGGHDLAPEGRELASKLNDAPLVRDRHQCSHQVSPTAWIMSARLTTSRMSTTSVGEWE